MKNLYLLASFLLLIALQSCQDSSNTIGTEEDSAQKLIEHIEAEHLGGSLFDTIQLGADSLNAPDISTEAVVYRVVTDSLSDGWLLYSHQSDQHLRVLISDTKITPTVYNDGNISSPTQSIDMSQKNANIIQYMAEYHLEPGSTLIHLTAPLPDTLLFFVAPRGIEE